jgi:ATP-dependent Clp protease ATP-binding subunit ClpC
VTYSFTERVREALRSAHEEARSDGHDWVDTHHLLLAVLRDEGSRAVAILEKLKIDVAGLREAVAESMTPVTPAASASKLPYTRETTRVLDLTMDEARDFNDGCVGTQHLLLGLIRVADCVPSQLLRSRGATLDTVRAAASEFTGSE